MKLNLTISMFSILLSIANHATAAEPARFKGPPHGGTPVQIGNHGFHLELVRDAQKGRFEAYVLDAHVSRYVPVSEQSFELVATVKDRQERLTFQRIPAPGSDQVAAKSHTFEAKADWIKTTTNFNGVFPKITLNSRTFTNITFSFPKGSMHGAH